MDTAIELGVNIFVEYAYEPIRRQASYIFCYRNHISELEEEVERLKVSMKDVKEKVKMAKSNFYKIRDDVETWLDDANKIIECEQNKISPDCLKLFQRYKGSRRAKKRIEEISKFINKSKEFLVVGDPATLEEYDSSSITDYQLIDSRTSTARDIKDALADTDVVKVVIYGMGGVGKSMLVREVKRLVKEENLFDEVITATVGQCIDIKAIQAKIGDMLRLKFEQVTESGRAAFLRNNLLTKNKILIVLDKLWKEIDLEDVGIPCGLEGNKGCKILITSRYRDVSTRVQKHFEVKPLNEEEAWKFFNNTVGNFVDNEIEPTAKEVAMKCSGLPLALDTFGKALKEKNIGIWKDSLNLLKNPSAVNITELSMKLYSSLRKSYDFIRDEEAKSVFLLCSVFPYDHCIPFESLSMYAMGMRLLDRVKTWEEARHRMMNLVDILRTSSLLSESSDEYVKMHDVIRDVSIYISSRKGQMSTLSYEKGVSDLEENERRGSYRAIFANCEDFPHLKKFKYPKLELLILYNGYEEMEKHQISGTCFAGMEEVKVLDMSRMCFPQQTTSLTHSLRNLRTLCMSHCDFEDANIIGELTNLEVLRMNFCQLKELPATMSQLTQLKVLEITNCFLLVIHPNIISKMINLEVFDVLNFSGWEEEVSCKNKVIKNAKLSEFKCLRHLTSLRLNILHHNTLSDLLELKLERFLIVVGSCLKDSEHVERYLNLGTTNLSLINNSDMRHLIGDQLGNRRSPNYYSSIDTLVLERMESFQSIVHVSVGQNPFNKLRVINVIDCNKLRNLFPFSIFEGLSILKEIEVSFCEMLEGLVSMKREKATIKSGISCLKFTQVSQLTSFCSKQHPENLISFFNHQVAFPELRILKFTGASNLKMLFKNNCLFSNSFCKLQNLEIGNCNKLRYIFSPSFLTTLVSLDKLTIEGCELLEEIFEMEEWINIDKESDILPKLRYVSVKRCPRLKSLFPPFIKCLERLEILDIDGPHEIFSEDKTFEIPQSNSSLFHEIVFPNLKTLRMTFIAMERNIWMTQFSIRDLFPNLKHFDFCCSDDDDWIHLLIKFRYVFSSLEAVNIINVPKDKTGVFKSMLHFTSFWVKKNVELKPHVASLIMFFTNLKFLSITGIDGHHLLNSSVIKRLVNLETMKIYNCQEMISILVEEDEDEDEYEDEDGEDEDEDGIIFEKLVKLELDKLPKLKSFHKGKCKLEFPCLEMLLIDKCDQMEIFSAEGIIRAPKLKRGHIRHHDISQGLPYDINEFIQDQMKVDEQNENLDDFIQMVHNVSKDV